MQTCVVIPTYMEQDNIEEVLNLLLSHSDANVLVVDDSSPDNTQDIVRGFVDRTRGRVQLLSRPVKDGLGRAYLDGFAQCIQNEYDIICEMDADLSHDPLALNSLIEPIVQDDADLVIGSRYITGGSIPNWSLYRRLLSRGGNVFARRLLSLSVNDVTGGYRAYRTDLVKNLIINDIHADGYGFQVEMVYLATLNGARISEVPIHFSDRTRGKSKMSLRIIAEAFFLVTMKSIRDRVFHSHKHYDSHKILQEADS